METNNALTAEQILAQIAGTLQSLQASQARMEERQAAVEQQHAAELATLRQQIQ